MLAYCQKVALSVISSPGFRNTVRPFANGGIAKYFCFLSLTNQKVLRVIVKAYKELEIPDFISICQVR